MKIFIKKSKRYQGFCVSLNEAKEYLTVETPEGKQVVRLALEDFLDRLGMTAYGFKRFYPRLEMGIHVKYLDLEGQACEGVASSIGGGGLFIEKLNPLPKGTDTRLEFLLPASQNIIKAKAKVVWIRKNHMQKPLYPGMGMKFVEISNRDREALMDFVSRFNQQRGLLRS